MYNKWIPVGKIQHDYSDSKGHLSDTSIFPTQNIKKCKNVQFSEPYNANMPKVHKDPI